MTRVDSFLQRVKANAVEKSKKMAALELEAWDETHEKELINHFGFTPKTVKQRKIELLGTAKS